MNVLFRFLISFLLFPTVIYSQYQKIIPADGSKYDDFGFELVLSDSIMLISAPSKDNGGWIYYYTFENGKWNYKDQFTVETILSATALAEV